MDNVDIYQATINTARFKKFIQVFIDYVSIQISVYYQYNHTQENKLRFSFAAILFFNSWYLDIIYFVRSSAADNCQRPIHDTSTIMQNPLDQLLPEFITLDYFRWRVARLCLTSTYYSAWARGPGYVLFVMQFNSPVNAICCLYNTLFLILVRVAGLYRLISTWMFPRWV